jgi:hypothetical protein
MPLTVKQETFCNNIIAGMSNKDAYQNAYNSKSDNAAWIESTKLLQKKEIQEKIESLRKPIVTTIQTNALTERQKQIDFIKSRIAHCQQTEDENSLIRWSDQLNKILGIYKEDIKTEAPESTVSRLDTDTLLKIAGSVQ